MEDESAGASSEESGGSSSENEIERAGNKRLKLGEKEDRISALPDSMIQHILSFLPSTKEAIRTGILSKRWRNQWTQVPVLIFYSASKSDNNFSQFIDTTLALHNCSKLKKFHIQYDDGMEINTCLTLKMRFATRKHVEELILHLDFQYRDEDEDEDEMDLYTLPKFLLKNSSLVKLELYRCYLPGRPNWSRLKELKLECHGCIETVVSGCPMLELLEITRCIGFNDDVIASKSLKRLIFVDSEAKYTREHLEISCPKLEELSIKKSVDSSGMWPLPDHVIENVLSSSPLLHTLDLSDCFCSDRFVIASKSLKKLALRNICGTSDYEISCPELEELSLHRILRCGEYFESMFRRGKCLTMKILRQVQHVKLLEIGNWFIKILSALELDGLPSPLLNCKCLTLDGTDFDEHLPGSVFAIHHSPTLEKLVIKLQLYHVKFASTNLNFKPNKVLLYLLHYTLKIKGVNLVVVEFNELIPSKLVVMHVNCFFQIPFVVFGVNKLNLQPRKPGGLFYLKDCRAENNWDSDGTVLNCSVSNLKTNLKTVKVVGLSKRDVKHNLVFNFVEVLLKNARSLEKIVIVLADRGTGFLQFEVSKKLLSFQRCFPNTTIELLCSN